MPRSARPTIRCITQDLGLELPQLNVVLNDIEHPWLEELYRIAQTSPEGQKRILQIATPLMYRLRISDHRGATWVDEDLGVVWLCAVHKREDGSEDDAYAWFAGLHAARDLLPTEEDRDRVKVDAALELYRFVSRELCQLVDEAMALPSQEICAELGDWLPCRALVIESEGTREIWCAVSIRDTDNHFISEQMRNLLFIEFERHLEPILMEARHDWPNGEVDWFEIVRLGVR